ncbi:MAG: hypothetical protein CML23_00125 [Rhizobiaceae bacterium]|nr:hypothetical protein [Rhizobiaceae bacterium]
MWKGQRYWPLHDLVVTRGRIAVMSRDAYREELMESASVLEPEDFDRMIETATSEEKLRQYREARRDAEDHRRQMQAEVEERLDSRISEDDYLKMLEQLLDAGAEPDAPSDDSITMLSWGDMATARMLLAHGADPNICDDHGAYPLHRARTGEKIRLLVAAGAKINARKKASADDGPENIRSTPLQSAISLSKPGDDSPINALLELGADAALPDSQGYSTLAYCHSEDVFRLIMNEGLDPLALQPGSRTLVHTLTYRHWLPRAELPAEVAFLDFLLGFGIDINARDERGRTMLHYAVENESYEDSVPNYEIVLARGADKNIRDDDGKRPFDLVAKSLKKVRAVLR